MNIGLSTAKWLAPTSWLFNFACQQYGMLSTPNMKDIADKYHAMFSPQPFFIGGFFFPQACIQLYWLYKLYTKPPTPASETDESVRYAPYFILGNFCIGIWMIFWNNERLDLSNIAVYINSFSQLYYLTSVLPPLTRKNALTHVVSKMFAGIGLLDVVDNTASAFFVGTQPNNLVYAATLLGSILMTGVSDSIMAACIVYDLVALTAGQTGTWQQVLGVSAVISGAMTIYKVINAQGAAQAIKDSKDE